MRLKVQQRPHVPTPSIQHVLSNLTDVSLGKCLYIYNVLSHSYLSEKHWAYATLGQAQEILLVVWQGEKGAMCMKSVAPHGSQTNTS